MDTNTALTLCLAQKFLNHLMPAQVLNEMEGAFDNSKSILAQDPLLSKWFEKVEVVHWGEVMSLPKIEPAIINVVTESLLNEKRFWVDYDSKKSNSLKKFLVNPLGLVYRSNIPYLVCTVGDYTNYLQLAIHRMQSVSLTEQPVNIPEDFNLGEYVGDGAFEYHFDNNKAFVLRAIVSNDAKDYFLERPDSIESCEKKDENNFSITAKMIDSLDLRHTLRGFGEKLDILEPLYLREAINQGRLFDPLTGLLDKGEFKVRLSDAIKRFERDNRPFSLFYLDIDNFSDINNMYGHPDGDIALTEVAKRIKEVVRPSDFVFRNGGEEFAVLLAETEKKEAKEVAERIRERIGDSPFDLTVSGVTQKITISIGVATFPEDSKDGKNQTLIKFADDRLYAAKDSGRNCVK